MVSVSVDLPFSDRGFNFLALAVEEGIDPFGGAVDRHQPFEFHHLRPLTRQNLFNVVPDARDLTRVKGVKTDETLVLKQIRPIGLSTNQQGAGVNAFVEHRPKRSEGPGDAGQELHMVARRRRSSFGDDPDPKQLGESRVPFAVPSDPIVAARVRALDEEGRNAFAEYQVPQAVLALKQGFGRLIRAKTDRGVLSLLDNRIQRMAYGKIFMESLPKYARTQELGEVERFLGAAKPA